MPFLNDLGIPVADLARGKNEAVEKLCAITGEDPAPVIHDSIIAVGHRRFQLCGQEFSAEFTTGVVTRFCPFCIDEDTDGCEDPRVAMHHRVRWRLAPFRTCPKHRLPMSDVRLGKWSDMIHELQAMLGAIEEQHKAAESCARRDPSPLQTYVERRLDGTAGPTWLDNQDIDQVCRAAEMLGGLALFGAEQRSADMTEDMWDAAGHAGWTLVGMGPDAIRDHLAQILKSCLRKNGHPSPRNAFGMLYGWLSASRLSKDPGPIRDIVREVIIDRVPLVPGRMLLGRTVTHPRLSSIISIAKAEGMHSTTLTNVLRVAGLIDNDSDLKNAHTSPTMQRRRL